ncbi:hypothetical protein C8J57DRAFT_634068 [Mycena rebaudengoi]|nr:hypothetical protein C8J57DRAFT_634068 [Mycena rebaudengoi]
MHYIFLYFPFIFLATNIGYSAPIVRSTQENNVYTQSCRIHILHLQLGLVHLRLSSHRIFPLQSILPLTRGTLAQLDLMICASFKTSNSFRWRYGCLRAFSKQLTLYCLCSLLRADRLPQHLDIAPRKSTYRAGLKSNTELTSLQKWAGTENNCLLSGNFHAAPSPSFYCLAVRLLRWF